MTTRICPNCGRHVAPEDHFCGGCRCPLAVYKPRKTFVEGIREGLVPAAGSLVFGLLAAALWVWLSGGLLRAFGRLMLDALERSALIMIPYILAITVLGAAADLILSGCFANSKVGQLLSTVGTTVALCLSGAFLSIFAKHFAAAVDAPAEMIHYMVSCVRTILILVPLVQGVLFLAGAGRKSWKALLWQAVILAVLLVIILVLEWVCVGFLHMGMISVVPACVIGGGMTLMIALVTRLIK